MARNMKAKTSAERFWAKVQKTQTHWLWIGAITNAGYGEFWFNGRLIPAHRWAYEDAYGPIPDGLTIDHKCRVRRCVWPAHLEPVTNRINILRGESFSAQNARKTHCPSEHPLFGGNLYTYPDGRRGCRACGRASSRQYRAIKEAV